MPHGNAMQDPKKHEMLLNQKLTLETAQCWFVRSDFPFLLCCGIRFPRAKVVSFST
jgi:hypothetical protein